MTQRPNRSRRLVERQLRKAGVDFDADDSLERFVNLVQSSYEEVEDARRLNDHAFAVASAEMAELNERLVAKNTELEEALESLMRSEASAELNAQLARKNGLLAEALRSQTRSQQMFETLASNSPLAIVYTDEVGRAKYMNEQAETIFDRPAKELLGLGWFELVPHDQHEKFTVVADGEPTTAVIEHEISHSDGTRIWVSTTVAPVVDDGEVTGWIANVEDITNRRQNDALLERLATTDSLTGLLNRYSFGQAVQERCASLGPGEQLVLALIDLDRFKLVNDTFGHPAGDQLLIEVAELMRVQARPDDLIARLGGDEFGCARVVRDVAEADSFGKELSVALHQPVMVERQVVHTGASIGLTLAEDASADPEDLMRDADTAMYRAKSSSSMRYCLFDQRFRQEVTRRFVLERELHDAVERCDVELAFQPIVDAVTHRAKIVEALARWNSPELGQISPIEFIETAEHLGLSRLLGRQILSMACETLGGWFKQNPHWRGLAVAVNVTYAQLVDDDFVDQVHRTLARNGLPGSALILELTEQALLGDFDRAVVVLNRLRQKGVRIAIDDFGTGYSALSYLARLEVDFLKIDKSFVQRLSHAPDQGDNRLTEAIVDLALRFQLTPIAEGVETTSQQRILRRFGCGLLQGYLFARPLWPDDPDLHAMLDVGRGDTTLGASALAPVLGAVVPGYGAD